MLFKVAWKNIWRSKSRSIVVIVAVLLGIWAGTFMVAFYTGMINSRIQKVIEDEVSHIQIHQQGFLDTDLDKIKYGIRNAKKIQSNLKKDKDVLYFSNRLIMNGIMSSSHGDAGVKIIGIDPQKEDQLTQLGSKIILGDYLNKESKKLPVLISEKQAEKYHLKLKSKVILLTTDDQDQTHYLGGRVVGIYKSHNSAVDMMNIYVPLDRMLNISGAEQPNEIAIMLKNIDRIDTKIDSYQRHYPELSILSWMDISPGMRLMVEATDTSMFIIVLIIVAALIFGIVNTMLMAVLERTREFGMLMAIGMNKWRIFKLVVIETLFLASIGAGLGLLIAYSFISYFSYVGIDLSVVSDALEQMGFSTIIFPELDTFGYLKIFTMVFICTLLASFYPARKALKLNPTSAIRKI